MSAPIAWQAASRRNGSRLGAGRRRGRRPFQLGRAAVAANAVAPAPRLAGVWEPKTFGIMVPNAPLSLAGQEIVGRNAAAMQAGKIMQTAWVSCRPGAVSTMTMPREKIVILESAGEVTMLFEMPRMVRRIRMNASHPQALEPGYVGDSVGHWEGNTLVVDTLGFNGYAELDARGQPTSARLHTVERFTPSADGGSIDIADDDRRSRVLLAALHHPAFLEEEPGAPSVRVRLHGKSPAGGLRERVLRARALSPCLHAGGRRRDGTVKDGVPPPGIVGVGLATFVCRNVTPAGIGGTSTRCGFVDRPERTGQLVVAQNIGRYQFRTVSISSDGRERMDLTWLRHAVDLRVTPHGESDELLASQGTVSVVVERLQRVVARVPEQGAG